MPETVGGGKRMAHATWQSKAYSGDGALAKPFMVEDLEAREERLQKSNSAIPGN